MGKEDQMYDVLFNMKFCSKQMMKSAAAAEKAAEKEKLQVKQALQKNNTEAARIYAENAIRKKNESLNYLRLSSRLDAAASRVQTAMQMQAVTKAMTTTVKGMDKILTSMDPMKISKVMDTFETQVENMDVGLGTMDAAFQNANASTVPVDDVDILMSQVAAQNNIEFSSEMAKGPLASRLSAPQQQQQEMMTDDDITARLNALEKLS